MLVEYSSAVFSEFKKRVLLIARDALAVLGDGDGDAYQPAQPLGLLARPLDPEKDADGNPKRGAGLLTYEDGHEGFAAPTTDPRALEFIPELPKGATCLYACNGTLIYLDGETGTLQIMARYKDGSVDKTHVVSLSSVAPGFSVQVAHGDGMRLSLTAGGKNSATLFNKAGNAWFEANDDGTVTNGEKNQVNGSMVVGNIPAATEVVTMEEFGPWKILVDAALTAAAAASGTPLNPTITSSASAVVTGSKMLKASKNP